jgi:hypothetical protein
LYAADPGEDPTTAEAIATLATKPWLGALSQWSAGSVHLTTTNITAAQAGKNLLIAFTGATWSYLDHVQVRYEPAPRARQVVRVATFTNQIQDTYVIDITGATYSNLNFGAREDFSVGTAVGLRKGLLRFDLTSLPAGYDSIKRITLKLTEHPTYDSTGSGLINAYRIAAANKEWVEGTGSGAAQDGSACWAYKAYSATSPTNWAGSPGLSTPGTDYDTETVGTFDFDTTSNRVYEVELAPYTPALRDALVAEWRGPQANNAGIVLIGPTVKGNELEIASSENSTTAARPVLTVEYYYTPKGTLIKIW